MLEQSDLNNEMTEIGIGRFSAQNESARKYDQNSRSSAGQRLMRKLLPEFNRRVMELLKPKKGRPTRWLVDLKEYDSKKIAFLTLKTVLNGIPYKKTMASMSYAVGKAIENEIRCTFLVRTNKRGEGIIKGAKTRSGETSTLRHIRLSMKHEEEKRGIENFEPWAKRDRISCGTVLIELLRVSTDLIEYVYIREKQRKRATRYVTATKITLDWIENFNNYRALLEPFWMPMTEPPDDWKNIWEGGYRTEGTSLPKLPFIKTPDKKFLRETFGTYISPDLIDKMYEEKQAPKLGGVQDYHTAFFSDIQNFSTFSEQLEPEKMVKLMNEYLTEMTDILLQHQGTLDKYIGDAIVAFYGAPAPLVDQEKKACSTALMMHNKLDELRKKWMKEDDWPDIVYQMQHRIGLNSGQMVTGNMGSEMRMNYTMMGDTVNLAARLEPAAKQYGVYILVGEKVYEASNDEFAFRFLDFLSVKGKEIPAKTYELIDRKESINKRSIELIKTFEEGLDNYFNQKWDYAIKSFIKSINFEDDFPGRNTNPSQVFIDRCNYFKQNPPDLNWDGVWKMNII